ncbi:MAG: hypothetical protein HY870_00800 [Chloroflexi bacterium]|nr:hypothetical protein [Chloroflexota bacterium]
MRNRLKASWTDPARRPVLLLGFGAVALSIVLLIVALTQLSPRPAEVKPTPTSSCVINCGPGPQTTQPIPKTLRLRSRSKSLVPVNVTKGDWRPTAEIEQAEWVFGTLVNYVIGLPASQENSDMLQAMSEADEIVVDLSNGQSLTFQYTGRQFVSAGSVDIFAQTRPGLTLVLLGDNTDQRVVVNADYVPDSEVGKAVPSSLAQINTPIELGGAKVTVTSARLVVNAPGVPVGSAFYMVDFIVENIGADAVDAAGFIVELQDYANQKYRLSDTASAIGPNPPPKGQLLPGIAASFTSGFEVPANVTGPVLVWNFKPNAQFRAQASVAVPLVGPTPTPDPRTRLVVQITQAYFNTEQTEMIIVGGVGNTSGVPVSINASDISLSTPDGVFATIRGSEPPLPFNVGPDQTLSFSLRFSRLPGASAILKVLLSSFQLDLQ